MAGTDRGDTKRRRVEVPPASTTVLLQVLPTDIAANVTQWLSASDILRLKSTGRQMAAQEFFKSIPALDIRGSDVLREDLRALVRENASSLRRVDMSGLTDSPDDIRAVVRAVGECPDLTHFELDLSDIGAEEDDRMMSSLLGVLMRRFPRLQSLGLWADWDEEEVDMDSALGWIARIVGGRESTPPRPPLIHVHLDAFRWSDAHLADPVNLMTSLGVLHSKLKYLDLNIPATPEALSLIGREARALENLALTSVTLGGTWTGADVAALFRTASALERVALIGDSGQIAGSDCVMFQWTRSRSAGGGGGAEWSMHQSVVDTSEQLSMTLRLTEQCMSAVFAFGAADVKEWSSVQLQLPGLRRALALLPAALDEYRQTQKQAWRCREFTIGFARQWVGYDVTSLLRRIEGLQRAQDVDGRWTWLLERRELELRGVDAVEQDFWVARTNVRHLIARDTADTEQPDDGWFGHTLTQLEGDRVQLESLVWEPWVAMSEGRRWRYLRNPREFLHAGQLAALLKEHPDLARIELGAPRDRARNAVPPFYGDSKAIDGSVFAACSAFGRGALRVLYLRLMHTMVTAQELLLLRGLEELGLFSPYDAEDADDMKRAIGRSTLAQFGSQNPDLRVLELDLRATHLGDRERSEPLIRHAPRLQRLELRLWHTTTVDAEALVRTCVECKELRLLCLALPNTSPEDDKVPPERVGGSFADLKRAVAPLADRTELRWMFMLRSSPDRFVERARPTNVEALTTWRPFLWSPPAHARSGPPVLAVSPAQFLRSALARAFTGGRVCVTGTDGASTSVRTVSDAERAARHQARQIADRIRAGLSVHVIAPAAAKGAALISFRMSPDRHRTPRLEWRDATDRTSSRRLAIEAALARLLPVSRRG